MHKKAQVTIFIVIGIVILIVLGLVFYFSSDDAEKRLFTDTDEEVVAVQNFIEQCLDAVAVPGVYLLAAQGGFIYLPEDHLQGDFGNVAYSYSFGENKLIAKNSMAEQLNQYIMSTFPGCINNFESFEGVPITANQPKASVTIQSTYIQVNLQYQVKVKDTTLDIFTKEISLPLGAMHGVAFQIIQEQAQNPDWIDLTGLQEYDYDVSVIPYDRETMLFAVTNDEFIFMIAAQFTVNDPPVLQLEDTYTIQEKQQFTLQIPYTDEPDDTILFSDDSPLFTITSDGLIDFKPEIPGTFEVTISATDSIGNVASKDVTFVVN